MKNKKVFFNHPQTNIKLNTQNISPGDFFFFNNVILKKMIWRNSYAKKHQLCMKWTTRACFDAILIMVTSVFRDESPESHEKIVRIEF